MSSRVLPGHTHTHTHREIEKGAIHLPLPGIDDTPSSCMSSQLSFQSLALPSSVGGKAYPAGMRILRVSTNMKYAPEGVTY
jgi:hypothetical protein